ncbi:MAG: excisionase family DNA binding protein [Candidatus Aldehydirespiratoraceae bacterium]|jgi:excisionase family DNA binding protein
MEPKVSPAAGVSLTVRPNTSRGRGQEQAVSAKRSGGHLVDIPTLAVQLGVTERFIRRLVEERRVPFHKIGKFVRFHPADIELWIEQQRVDQLNDH